MGMPIIIYGKSGSGKSTSLREFKKNEVLYINAEKKQLPLYRFRFDKTVETDDIPTIKGAMIKAAGMGVKVIVLDDIGLIMTHTFMSQHRDKRGSSSFEMYDDIADAMYGLVTYARQLEGNVRVYFMLHEDKDENGDIKIKTIGKLLDNKCPLAERVTVALRCMSDDKGRHFFRTNTDGRDITKSPIGMFSEVEIDNDLRMVDQAICEYYGLEANYG